MKSPQTVYRLLLNGLILSTIFVSILFPIPTNARAMGVDNRVHQDTIMPVMSETSINAPNVPNAPGATDDEPNITINDVSQSEGSSPMNFTVSLSSVSASDVSVNYTTNNGTAAAPGDYTSKTGILTIPAGDISGTIDVTIINDSLYEANETFTIDLSTPVSATITDAQGLGTIQDNDTAPTISITDVSQSEGSSPMNFTVSLSSVSGLDASVNYTTNNGTAAAPGDYTSKTGILTIPAGSISGTIGIAISNDSLYEANETFTIDLSTPVSATITDAQGLGTIQDNDTAPTISIADVSQSEGSSPMNFTVSLSSVSGLDASVNYTTNNGTAAAPGDYTSKTGILIIPAGDTSGTIDVTIINDSLYEANETFTIDLSTPVNASIADAQGLGTIQDNDAAPTISIADVSQSEGSSPMNFTVSLSSVSGLDASVNYTTNNGTAAAPGDYTSKTGILTIPAGDTSGTIDVTIINDSLYEANETFTIDLSTPVSATITDAQGLGTIQDNDTAPTISIADVSQSEGSSPMNFTVSLSSVSGLDASVNYTTNNGTAAAPGDYTSKTGILTIPAGSISGTIGIAISNDSLYEANETFTIDLSTPVSATITDAQGLGTIQDNDTAPTISIADVSQSEGSSPMNFTVSLSSVSGLDASVNYTTNNGTAAAPGDYTSKTGILTIPAGSISGTIGIAIIDDSLDEDDETFTIDLSTPENASIADARGVGTIQDNDGTPTISIADVSQSEGSSPMNFTVSLSNASASAISVNYTTNNGTALAPGDYTSKTGILIIPAGSISGTIGVAIIDDSLDEANETFTVDLSTPVNAAIADAQALGTIQDNDAAPSISIADVSQSEDSSPMSFTVSLSSVSALDVSVNYKTNNGTALAPGDYASKSGILTIPAGSTSGTISVTIIDDSLDEDDETFTIDLSNPVNAAITDARGVGTIQDNDVAGISIEPVSGLTTTESGDAATFSVVLDTEPIALVIIVFLSLDPSEGAILPVPFSLTFTPLDWDTAQEVTITGVDDDQIDGNQLYFIQMQVTSGDSNYNGFALDDIAVTNLDNDQAADTETPTVNWILPVLDGKQKILTNAPEDQVVHLEANASDNVAIEHVRFRRWDAIQMAWVDIANVYNQPYQTDLDTSVLRCGFNQVNVEAYDTAGNNTVDDKSGVFIWLIRYCYVYMPSINR